MSECDHGVVTAWDAPPSVKLGIWEVAECLQLEQHQVLAAGWHEPDTNV